MNFFPEVLDKEEAFLQVYETYSAYTANELYSGMCERAICEFIKNEDFECKKYVSIFLIYSLDKFSYLDQILMV